MSGVAELVSLDGQAALVTGGSGGIGRACVALLAQAGARVASADRAGQPAPEGAALTLEGDLARADTAAAWVADTVAELGRLDLVVHAAGITRDAVLWKLEPAAWDEVLRVNLDSAFHLMRAAVPHLRAGGGGRVVLITSINGERGKFGQANYAASKAGLIGLARSAARETGRFGIHVNCVAPGLIRTAMTKALPADVLRQAEEESALGRAGRPGDVARAVLFLCSPLAAHVTGQVLRVDGGQLTA